MQLDEKNESECSAGELPCFILTTYLPPSFCFQGEKSFFLLPGESMPNGIQDIFVLGEDEGLILRATEAFTDSEADVRF